MDGPGSTVGTLLSDQVFLFLAITIVVLMTMAVAAAVVTFLLRLRNEKEDRLWARLNATWEPILLDSLSDAEKLPDLWKQVEERNQLRFLEFVLQYAQRLGGEERDVLKKAAAPFLDGVLPLLRNRRIGIRARAVQTLGTLGLPEYTSQ
ncbi:MAG: hypothetical protein KJN92_04385, partial [Gemmatimonadetes bacterium]|nr:hypothetical protein [Gemmatimonadota bacterium]